MLALLVSLDKSPAVIRQELSQGVTVGTPSPPDVVVPLAVLVVMGVTVGLAACL
jgi:hypothetical protein